MTAKANGFEPRYRRVVIGAVLRRHRRRLCIRQDQVASAMGVAPSQISRIEGGKCDLSVVRYMQFAEALDLSPLKLFMEIVLVEKRVLRILADAASICRSRAVICALITAEVAT